MLFFKTIFYLAFILLLPSCTHDDGYRIAGNKVLYEQPWNAGYGTAINELDADPVTFKVLGEDNMTWAKDANSVFWGYVQLDFMDAETFEVLSINFAKDKEKVICGRDVIIETNPDDFEIRYFTESTGFIYIYGIDKFAAYLCSKEPNGYIRIQSQSINSFHQLEDEFYQDKNNVWWGGIELPNVNPNTFKVLGGGYATDGNSVFYHNRIVDGAHIESFEVIGSYRAKDKNYEYKFEEMIE